MVRGPLRFVFRKESGFFGGFMAEGAIDNLWIKLQAHAGETFHTITGLPFAYRIENECLVPIRNGVPIRQSLTRQNFERALGLLPFNSPGEINNIIRGPAYVYALLHDPRIMA
jgi:hypothetical protein